MDFAEIKNLGEKALRELLAEKRAELHRLRFSVAARELKNVRSIRVVRKTIAQILTMLGQKQAVK